jgi:glycogen debranching enzyme
VDRAVRERYRWTEERYLYDSFHERRPVPRLRPNALLAVAAGLFEPAFARGAVERAAEDDLTTPWGVRTLSRHDAGYSPTAYHDGQVWTIATAWAAEAAWAAGVPDLGVRYLRTIAERFGREGGFANECYRGDRDEPFDSCFLLGFSVGPFLSVLFERLWGLGVDGTGPRLRFRPAFPTGWTGASLEGLRIGSGRATIRVEGRRATVRWDGPRALVLELRSGFRTVEPGRTVTVDAG